MTEPCSFDGCENKAQRAGLCWGHIRQRLQGKALTQLRRWGMTPKELREEAALAFADADTSEDSDAAAERAGIKLRVYTLRAVRRLGKTR